MTEEPTEPQDPAAQTEAAPAEDVATPTDAESPAANEPEADPDTPADAATEADPAADAGAPAEGDPDAPEGEAGTYEEKIEVGGDVFVNVSRITPYGAFVTLTDGRTGLIHISEIDRNYVKDVREHLREGDRVEARITAIKEDGKIDLSIKAMQDPQPRMQRGRDPEFEKMLKGFLRSSDERQVDFKRSQMHKKK